MANELINEATDILRKWLANEEIIDRTIDDNFTLMGIRKRAADFITTAGRVTSSVVMPPPQVNLEAMHEQLIREVGVFVDVFRQPSQWCYVLRSASSSEVLMNDDRVPTHAGNFSSYTDALAAGIKAANRYNKDLIH